MHAKLVVLLLFTLISWRSPAMDPFMASAQVHHVTGYSNVYSYVSGSLGAFRDADIDNENSTFLNSCISEIRRVCPALLNTILKELPKSGCRGINFVFSDKSTDGTSFVQPKDEILAGQIEIVVNLSKARFMGGQLFSMVPTLKEIVSLADEEVCMIYETPSPFWLTIAHELIHLKHWLDEKAGRTSLDFKGAFCGDIKSLSYSAAKGETVDLVLSEFNKCCNPFKLLALVDNLNLYFKKSTEVEAINGMIKCLANLLEKTEEELRPEFLGKDKKQSFLYILTKLETHFPFAIDAFIELKTKVETGIIEDSVLTNSKRLLFTHVMSADKSCVGMNLYAKRLVDLFPEVFLSIRTGMSSIWPELEERRTVFGPDIDDISEASIRMIAGLPLRYIYQDRIEYFVEYMRVFDTAVSSYLRTLRTMSIRHNTFPTSMSLMPLAFLFKMHQFKLRSIFDDCGNLQLLAEMFGYTPKTPKNVEKFLKVFE